MTTFLFGTVLGLFFGLTGSGGSTLAVPMLVYGLGLAPHRAVCVSMISVGAMAALSTIQRLRHREVESRTGFTLAVAGLPGAPAGVWVGRTLAEKWLLAVFGIVVASVALRLLLDKTQSGRSLSANQALVPMNSHCGVSSGATPAPASVLALCATGFVTGFLAGLLGIGGGFVVVPALVLFCGLEMHRAIATSMFSIAIISLAAMTAHWVAGQRPPLDTIALFTLGGVIGLTPGSMLGRRLPSGLLQRTFAAILLLLALFIIARSLGAF